MSSKDTSDIERKCSNCSKYVNGYCIAYKRAQPVFPDGYCNKHRLSYKYI